MCSRSVEIIPGLLRKINEGGYNYGTHDDDEQNGRDAILDELKNLGQQIQREGKILKFLLSVIVIFLCFIVIYK